MLQHLGGYHKKVMDVVADDHFEAIRAEPVKSFEADAVRYPCFVCTLAP